MSDEAIESPQVPEVMTETETNPFAFTESDIEQ